MKKSFGILFGFLVFFTAMPAWALDWNALKPQYGSISFNYAQEVNTAIIHHAGDYDYDSRQVRLVLGRRLNSKWRLEGEMIFGQVREYNEVTRLSSSLYGFELAILYDILTIDRFTFFIGAAGGLGYLSPATGYAELGRNPFGLLEGRGGVDIKLTEKYYLRALAGLWHISSVFKTDQGHNDWIYGLQIGRFF